MVDQVPLAEISSIREMHSDEKHQESNQRNQLMIETQPLGYNSGRTYYLQAESESLCVNLIRTLSAYAAVALERAQAQSTFALAQRRVNRVYRSSPFQILFAVLIIAVSAIQVFILAFEQVVKHILTVSPTEFHCIDTGCAVQETRRCGGWERKIRLFCPRYQPGLHHSVCRRAPDQLVCELASKLLQKWVEHS